jgi:AcrR family transcriptional regulator
MAGERGAYAKGLARRELIIDSAMELFGRIGYRNATILDIATHVGISRTGLLHHFPSKESLLEAVLAKREHDNDARFDDGGSPLSGLLFLVDLARYNTQARHIVGLFAVLSAEAGDPSHPAHDYFVARYEQTQASFRRALVQARDAGFLVPGVDVDHAARSLIALMDGYQVQWLLAPDRVDMAAELRTEIQRLLVVPLDAPTAAESVADPVSGSAPPTQ